MLNHANCNILRLQIATTGDVHVLRERAIIFIGINNYSGDPIVVCLSQKFYALKKWRTASTAIKVVRNMGYVLF
jgi:hypothetical protein